MGVGEEGEKWGEGRERGGIKGMRTNVSYVCACAYVCFCWMCRI